MGGCRGAISCICVYTLVYMCAVPIHKCLCCDSKCVCVCLCTCALTPTEAHSSPACNKLFYSIIKNPTDPGGTPIEKPIPTSETFFPFLFPFPVSFPIQAQPAWENAREMCKYRPPGADVKVWKTSD